MEVSGAVSGVLDCWGVVVVMGAGWILSTLIDGRDGLDREPRRRV